MYFYFIFIFILQLCSSVYLRFLGVLLLCISSVCIVFLVISIHPYIAVHYVGSVNDVDGDTGCAQALC